MQATIVVAVLVIRPTAEPNEVPFELKTLVGSGNHLLDGGPDLESSVQKQLNRSRCHLGCGLI